jgi:hypothetical protein
MNYNSQYSTELTTPELRCLAGFIQLLSGVLLQSHIKHTLSVSIWILSCKHNLCWLPCCDSEEEGEHQHDVGEGGEEGGHGVAHANEDHVLPQSSPANLILSVPWLSQTQGDAMSCNV